MWEIVRAGGPLMWPIILCSITAAAIILERLWTLQDRRVLPQELPQRVWQLIEGNQVNDKVIAALEQNSPLGKLLAAGLANRHRPREILMERLEDAGRHVVYELERYINTLGTIASVSPLLGPAPPTVHIEVQPGLDEVAILVHDNTAVTPASTRVLYNYGSG